MASEETDGGPERPRPLLIDRIPHGELHDGAVILDRFMSWISSTGLEPYAAQEEALLEIVTGRHVILSTPTGSGKSLVALGMHFKAMCEGRRSFYTAPIKALVSEKFFALCEQFGPENVGMLTGDATINWSAPIICCTAEVLSNMAVTQGRDTDTPYVVMDEFHYYAEADRGVAWQLPLLVLDRTQFLLMSATLGDVREISSRITEATGREVAHVHSDDRPVPLDFDYRETSVTETVETLLESDKDPIYIVHFTQREAAEQAQGLTSAKIANKSERKAIGEAIGDFRFDSPYGKDIRRFLRSGIGIHHAGLLPKYRLLVEQLAQRGLLKVICGTDTLGVGVNIPIRTVLFTALSKYDGEKVALLSVRNFKQIAGRAGRRGFDDRGSVVCQAPEHVVENKKTAAKVAARPGRSKAPKKRAPRRGMVPWTRKTFEKLAWSSPETLTSRFRVSHGLVVSCLQSERAARRPGGGYRQLVELIETSHERPGRKKQLRREAAVLFRALRGAGIVELVRGDAAPRVRVSESLQADFSLHHTLSLFLVDACELLDPAHPDYALDLLTLVESVLENPRAILYQMLRKEKEDLLAELKAERVPYEERIEKLDALTWRKPRADFIYSTFNLFADRHPWVGNENIQPKAIARELYESYASFDDFVKRFNLARMEGVVLRYLNQVFGTLARNVPEGARTEEVLDLMGYLRTLVVHVDSSLVQEWESLLAPAAPSEPSQPAPPRPRRQSDDPRAFRARIRSECHALVRSLARGHYEEAAAFVWPDPDEPWDVDRFTRELEPFFAEHEHIVFDASARLSHLTHVVERAPGMWDVHQTLVDESQENLWNVEAVIDLREEPPPDVPLLRLRRIGV